MGITKNLISSKIKFRKVEENGIIKNNWRKKVRRKIIKVIRFELEKKIKDLKKYFNRKKEKPIRKIIKITLNLKNRGLIQTYINRQL